MDLLNLIFAGGLDGGKSTLVGRVFHERGEISDKLLRRLRRHAEAAGKPTCHFAFFTDTNLDERERGVTVETKYRPLRTDAPARRSATSREGARAYNVIDAPGHPSYVKNMISGAAQADAAVLVVDAAETAEAGLAAQTREHLVILAALGVQGIVVAVNKMDAVGYDRGAFDACAAAVEGAARELGVESALAGPGGGAVPISALEGDSVAARSPKLSWYDGPPLIEILESLPAPVREVDRPLVMPVVRTFSVPGEGAVAAGRIETGRVSPGERVVIAPYPGTGAISATVASIERERAEVPSASAGEDASLLLADAEQGFAARQVKKGAVLGSAAEPPRAASAFRAEIRVVDHPKGMRERYSPQLHVHQAATPCAIEEVLRAADPSGAVVYERGAGGDLPPLTNGFVFAARLRPRKPVVIRRADDLPRLGRFVLRDGRTVAAGRCIELAEG